MNNKICLQKNQIKFATIGILSVCLWYDLTYSAENLPGCIEEMKLMTHQVNVVRKEAVTQPEKNPYNDTVVSKSHFTDE